MLNRFALLATTACMLVPMGTAPLALADPDSDPAVAPVDDPGPLPDNGIVGSADTGCGDHTRWLGPDGGGLQ